MVADFPDFEYTRVPGRPRWYIIAWYEDRAGSDGADEEANGARLRRFVEASRRRKMVDFGMAIAVTERTMRWLRRELSGYVWVYAPRRKRRVRK